MSKPPSRWLVVLAFATIYIIWGSAYIGIHFAIETLPPFFMMGVRFTLAGVVLIGAALLTGTPLPSLVHWRSALIAGAILFLINNTSIVWAEAHGVPSGVAAVLIATVPMWIVMLNWLRPGGKFPGGIVIAGLVIGFIGILLLISPQGTEELNVVAMIGVVFGAFAWALGSLYAKSAPLPKSAPLATGMQLFCGGVCQLILSVVTGDIQQLGAAPVSASSVLALVYLALFSSVVGFSAFTWLMRVSTPAKVATYAYVNPIVAVILGWLLANEAITPRMLIATGIIVAAVVMISSYRDKRLSPAPEAPPEVTKAAEAVS